MQNSRGDRESPWYVPHLMLTWAISFELARKVVFQSPIQYSMKTLGVLCILYGSKQSRFMCLALSCRFSCSQSTHCTGWSSWSYSLFTALSITGVWLLCCHYLSGPCSRIEPNAYQCWSQCCLTGASMLCRGRLLAGSWMESFPSGVS